MTRISYPPKLPISAKKDEIITALRQNRVLVIAGDTGSGKTTQIPKMCLEAGLGRRGLIGCTQPRRIAAVSVAERVAEELGESKSVGYKIRFRDRTTADTLIKFMTDGVLLAETRQDMLLGRYDTIIIDEAHERSLNIDFLLGYLRDLLAKRDDLKLIISSATLDTEKFSTHFDHAPVINVSGRTYPITVDYFDTPFPDKENKESYVELAVRMAISLVNEQPDGDMLVFMPTERDILDCSDMLKKKMGGQSLILPLFGRLQVADQRKIFRPSPRRKIIVATNIAETSLTVPGIRYVIDTGLARIARYNPRSMTTSLQVARVSQASCDQRSGRCGRTGPGHCLRLFSEEDYLSRPEFTQPEIQRSNLAEVILQMISLGLGNPRDFPFIDPPTVNSVRDGFRLLRELGAIDHKSNLTSRGRIMAGLPLDPCISRILIEAAELGAVREIKVIAAGLSIQDPRIRPAEQEEKADRMHRRFADKNSDFLGLLNIWDTYRTTSATVASRSKLRKFCTSHYLSWQRMREWQDIHDQITQLTKGTRKFHDNDQPASSTAIHQALLTGFIRNIGQKKEKNIYQISGGREAMIFPGSALFNHGRKWVVCGSFMETRRLFGLNVANIDVQWLERIGGDLCRRSWSDPHWEKKSGQVVALEKVTLFGLIIVAGRRVNYGRINKTATAEAREIFIRQALVAGELGGQYTFMRHNRSLIKKLEQMEDRTRRRDIMVDEHALFNFYDTRLGPVYDRYTLNRTIRKRRGDGFLKMTEADICLATPDTDDIYRFPEKLSVGSHKIRLSYRFEPGHEADGITAHIPLALAESLTPGHFEWLVPGLIEEKVANLLKYLPKTLRRQLVPLPDCVERIMDDLDLYNGSFYAALEKSILKSNQVRIKRADWQPDKIPPHLRMRFLLLQENGKAICTTRSYADLLYDRAQESTNTCPANHQQHPPDIPNINSWDFIKAPAPIPLTGPGRISSGYLYPTLLREESPGTVTLHYINDRNESIDNNRIGLRALYSAQCRAEVKALTRECKAALASHSASWLSLGLKSTGVELRDMLLNFLLDELFKIEDGTLPDKKDFDSILADLSSRGMIRSGKQMLTHVLKLLADRRQVSSTLEKLSRTVQPGDQFGNELLAQFRNHLDELLPPDFLLTRRFSDLEHTLRYLRGLTIRMERARHSPMKDTKKAEQIRPAIHRLLQLKTDGFRSVECCTSLLEYRQMIEELKISVFAPELGTAMPVSEKRLKKKWQEVENLCHQVE